MKVKHIDLGLIDYKKAWDYQEEVHKLLTQQKLSNEKPENSKCIGEFILCEHPNVYTLGKSGQKNNLLINEQFLENIQATYFEINRGGDITYHGPGQIVGYPIIDLDQLHIGVKKYVYSLEEVIIRTIAKLGLNGHRLKEATGVWLDIDQPGKTRKICAIGVRVSRGISMHGFALNVNTDLTYFSYINPCGYLDKGVTSIEKELGRKINLTEIKEMLKTNFNNTFMQPD